MSGADEFLSPYLDTVADLRRFLAPFDDECPIHGDLRMRFVLDLARGSHLRAISDDTSGRFRTPHALSPYPNDPCEDDANGTYDHTDCAAFLASTEGER